MAAAQKDWTIRAEDEAEEASKSTALLRAGIKLYRCLRSKRSRPWRHQAVSSAGSCPFGERLVLRDLDLLALDVFLRDRRPRRFLALSNLLSVIGIKLECKHEQNSRRGRYRNCNVRCLGDHEGRLSPLAVPTR